MRKDLSVPVVSNGTLSTAGRTVVLTAPEVLAALQALDADKERKAEALRTSRQLRERRAAELKAEREVKALAAEQTRARKAWKELCGDVVQAAQSLQLLAASPRKRAHRRRAAKQRPGVQAVGRPLPVREAWHQASTEAAALGLWRLSWDMRSPGSLV